MFIGVSYSQDNSNSSSGNPFSIDPHFGAEINVKNIVFIRAGVGNIQKTPDLTNKIIYTIQPNLGLGINIKGIEIEYIWENEPLGTAGALKLVPEFNTEHVLLMNSDLLTDVDFESLYLKMLNESADMVVATTEYKVDIPYAILQTDGHRVNSFKEKPTFRYQSNAGIYIFKKSLIDLIPRNTFYDITDLMEQLISDGGKLVYDQIIGYWVDIGMPADYEQAKEFVKHIK